MQYKDGYKYQLHADETTATLQIEGAIGGSGSVVFDATAEYGDDPPVLYAFTQ